MRLVITPEESGRLDAASPEPVERLMERAGAGVAAAAIRMGAGYGTRVVVLAGKGNNGGDGFVAARYLSRRGAAVEVHSLGFPKGEHSPARKAAAAAVAAGVHVAPLGAPRDADLVVDAVFGVGFRGELPSAVAAWTETPVPVLAVDVPSGLDAMSGEVAGVAFRAERTVTFHALKPGHLVGDGPEYCGSVEIVDIGLHGGTAELMECEDSDAPAPVRPRTAHKWSAGSVVVVGGSPGITGAAMLTARAALSGGAGAVAIACPDGLRSTYAAMSPGVMAHGFGDGDHFGQSDVGAVLEFAERFDVMVLGPGLGRSSGAFARGVVEGRVGRLVVDADGLDALDGVDLLAARRGETVITPHGGEFTRLTGEPPAYTTAAAVADKAGIVVLLKGNPTFVLGSERWVVTSGGPELATIGTGDVLGGLLGALWARGLPAEIAARSAAHRHGRAGATLGAVRTVTAEALADEIGRFA